MSKLLGEPLMPWQRLVADVGLEVVPETGRYAYREVWVTVPRQSGKTTLVLCVELDRGLVFPAGLPELVVAEHDLDQPQSIVYTAQTGFDARRKLIEDQADRKLPRSKVWPFVDRVFRGVGNESINLVNGSTIQPLSSSADAGHGRTIDLSVADEAFADVTGARETALLPAMATRPWGQLWGISTAGTEASVWLKSKVELGRATVDEGDPSSSIAYFEWSADADDDPADEDRWATFMPALGRSIDISVVRHARETMEPEDFDRSFRNLWTVHERRLIPAPAWDAVCDPTIELDAGIVLGIDADPELVTGSLVACDELGHVELVDSVPLAELVGLTVTVARAQGAKVALDAGGPLASKLSTLVDELGDDRVLGRNATELVVAAGELFSAIGDGSVTFRTDGRLEVAAASATKRKVGDRWAFVRLRESIPLVAASLAYASRRSIGDHEPEPEPEFLSL